MGALTVKGIRLHIVEVGHSFIEGMPYQPGSSAQRIRIGLTSLAIVFLIVLVASAVTRAGRDDTENSAQQASQNEPSEPLADIGVAPGSAEQSNNASAASKAK